MRNFAVSIKELKEIDNKIKTHVIKTYFLRKILKKNRFLQKRNDLCFVSRLLITRSHMGCDNINDLINFSQVKGGDKELFKVFQKDSF